VKHVQRAQIILLSAERLPVLEIAKRVGISRPMVWCWQQRFAEEGHLRGLLRDKTRPPGIPPVPQVKVHAVVERKNVVAFYNKRSTCEQWIKEGKGAIKWTRLSCRSFAANAARLQLHALAYNLGNFLRTLVTPEPIKAWSLTNLKEKLIKISVRSSSAMASMSPFRWPRSPFPRIGSVTFC
jgi:hypothetical protein